MLAQCPFRTAHDVQEVVHPLRLWLRVANECGPQAPIMSARSLGEIDDAGELGRLDLGRHRRSVRRLIRAGPRVRKTAPVTDDPTEPLRAIHEQLWDPAASLVRVPAAVNPLHLDLHSVRESLLGAVLDFSTGEHTRAQAAIWRVLACQYREGGHPWSGTFKVCAEEHAPPEHDAIEWFHYDPNWRQFIGCTLAYVLESFRLPGDLARAAEESIAFCVHGEPADRIPDWYTNPALMHAWLTAWLGARRRDSLLIAAGEQRARRIVQRVERNGDVDEYNSPTYDGVDLFAIALWRAFPPSSYFADAGGLLASVIGARLGALFHPRLAAICGPYIRAYGLALDRYVSLAGQWLALAGAQHVLPDALDEHTGHVHDLYFWPLFRSLAPEVVSVLELRAVDAMRLHTQRFGPVSIEHRVLPDAAIGAERGRAPQFALDQYVPCVAHVLDGDDVAFLGVMLGGGCRAIDARFVDDRTLAIEARGEDAVGVRFMASAPPRFDDDCLQIGPISVEFATRPTRIEANGCTWAQPTAAMHLRLA